MERRRRRLSWIAVGLCLIVGAAYVAHRTIAGRVDRAIAEASAEPPGLTVEEIPGHRPAFVETGRPRLWTDTTRARDGATLDGRAVVATSGGLVELDSSGRARRVLTALDGLTDHDLTALTSRGTTLHAGTRSGLVLIIEGERSRALAIAEGRLGAVVDLAWHEGALYVATSSGTVVRLSGTEARALSPEIRGGVAALAAGPSGLHAAGADGAVYHVTADDRLEQVAAPADGEERATALAWAGDRLFVGTPTALLRSTSPAGGLEEARRDLFVSALLVHEDRLYVGTIGDGVVVLDPSRPAERPHRHLLRGRRVDRLRLIDGRPTAFGPALVATLGSDGEPRVADLPEGIASDHVTALAFDGRQRLWVGHFDEGVDILDGAGRVERHLPDPERQIMSSVNALAWDVTADAMLVATSHGVLVVGDGGVDVLDAEDGLIGDGVNALLVGGRERVFATSRGLSVSEAGVVRSIYAFHGLPSNRLYAVAGRADRLYVGTLGGLAVIEGLRVRRVVRAAPTGLSANWCAAVAAAPDGAYVGTTGGGVDHVLDDGTVRPLPLPGTGRITVNPGAMLLLGESLLVGTLERGLVVYDIRRDAWVENDGGPLPGASVTALAADDEDLYVGTDRGLLRLRRSALGGQEA